MRFSNKGIMILILFLAVSLIGLVVGIVVVKMQSAQVDDPEMMTQAEGEVFVEIVNKAIEMPAEDAIDYLDGQLGKYEQSDEMWCELMLVKVDVYRQADMIKEAVDFLEGLDISNLSDIYKKAVYYRLYELNDELGNEEKAAYYLEDYQKYENYGIEW